METTIQKWGNSLAVRLPKAITEKLTLRQGSRVQMRERTQGIFISPVPKQKSLKERAQMITPENLHGDVWSLLEVGKGSFGFWDNTDDAIYDAL